MIQLELNKTKKDANSIWYISNQNTIYRIAGSVSSPRRKQVVPYCPAINREKHALHGYIVLISYQNMYPIGSPVHYI